MKRVNYYNENNPEAVYWLRELIQAGEIPPGEIDDRSIEDVKPNEIAHYTQHHFFAGIGGWALALRLAGWPDDEPVRTASCPCQPFSQTGKQLGFADKRHLWPVLFRLIEADGGRIPITFGEQVASPLGREWIAGVRVDLESVGHEVGGADLCAAGVGSPHIRQRLYWVAFTTGKQWFQRCGVAGGDSSKANSDAPITSAINGMAYNEGEGRARVVTERSEGLREWSWTGRDCTTDRLGDADSAGPQGRDQRIFQCDHQWPVGTPNLVVLCEDGKARRFEPGSFPLAHGVSGRVGLLRGYGNAIVPQLAAEFIQAAREAIGGAGLTESI